MKVQDAMVRDVVTIDAAATLVDAANRMREANVGVLPVTENGEVSGVVTDRDLVVRAMARNADASSTHVRDCVTREPRCARPDWDVDEALEVMAEEQVGRLPVIDDEERVVGIVTLSSLALRSREEREALRTAKRVSQRSAKGPAAPEERSGGPEVGSVVTVTERARVRLRTLIKADRHPTELFPRLVRKSGVFGLIADRRQADDEAIEHEGAVLLLIGRDISEALAGSTIDCEGTAEQMQLVIRRPGARVA